MSAYRLNWRGARRRKDNLAADAVEKYIDKTLRDLKKRPVEKLVDERYDKIRKLGTEALAET